jgi:hypothetical protein
MSHWMAEIFRPQRAIPIPAAPAQALFVKPIASAPSKSSALTLAKSLLLRLRCVKPSVGSAGCCNAVHASARSQVQTVVGQFESLLKGHDLPGPPATGLRRWGGLSRAAKVRKRMGFRPLRGGFVQTGPLPSKRRLPRKLVYFSGWTSQRFCRRKEQFCRPLGNALEAVHSNHSLPRE